MKQIQIMPQDNLFQITHDIYLKQTINWTEVHGNNLWRYYFYLNYTPKFHDSYCSDGLPKQSFALNKKWC